ncbi:hypothetical protein [Nocardia acidivorans]|uniref:hypothetical protein n=1 Tax=Nocardia acidivorans TaxID=404580 RepID=UPI000AEC0928|nr:hypothetical protein [Nocardia acidivorans]
MTDYSATWNSPTPRFDWKKVGNRQDEIDPTVRNWANLSVVYGEAAGIDPRLVMAIVLNEGADSNLSMGGTEGAVKDDVRWWTSPLRIILLA